MSQEEKTTEKVPCKNQEGGITLSQALGWSLDRYKSDLLKDLLGKALTLADASFQDRDQRKAFKDLLKQMVYSPVLHDSALDDLVNLVGEAVGDREEVRNASQEGAVFFSHFDAISYSYYRGESGNTTTAVHIKGE